MSVFSNSWRCSLFATALLTMLGSAPATVTADDQPARTPPSAADREKVQQLMRSMREKIAQLEKDGKHDEAEKLKHEAYEMMSKLRASFGGSSAQPVVSGPEADKIREQVKELSHQADQLEKDGRHEDAARLRTEARTLYSKILPRASATTVPGGPEREQLYQQMRAVHEKIETAKQEGNPEAVQRLMKEAEALRAKLNSQGNYASGHSPSGGDREARMQHLRAAAENLMAAGCQPEAQHVMQMIEQMRAEGGGERRPRGEANVRANVRPGGESSGSVPSADLQPSTGILLRGAWTTNPRDDANATAVQELRGQIEQMRRELREMREQLNKSKSGDRK